jgi:hypothetical protein
MEKAILIPMNEERGISAREAIIRRQGAVFWRLIAPGGWVATGFPHPEIHNGYIYDVSVEKVTHECEIAWVKPMSHVPFDDGQKYGIGMYKHRDEYDTVAGWFYVFNIVAIRPLGQPLSLSAFRKYEGGEPVKLVRNYCIVQSPVGAKCE